VQTIKVDLATKRTEDGRDYFDVNPKGSVPALVTDHGDTLTEAAVVIQFLADLAPESRLLPPAGSFERYRALEWLNFIATEVHKAFGPLWSRATPDATVSATRELLAKRFDYLDGVLSQRPYLMGDRFTAPDAYAFTILKWAALFHIDLARWPSVAGFVERVGARAQVRQAMMIEGLIKAAA
jgi:glutathione S-transferase